MVTSGKRFIINQDKKNSAVTQLTDNVAKPISIPSSLQQEKEIPAGVQKIIQNQPGTPNGSISAPDKSNAQLRLEYQKQQLADKARDIKESVISNAKSLGDSFVSGLSKIEEKVGSEVSAAAATKFTMNAAEVEEAARREASLLKVENKQAQEGKPRVESEFGRMVGDTSKLQEPFKLKLGFSPSPFKTGYLNFLGDEVSLTNGTSSITKPVIKTIDYKSVLGQAYDTITYKAANEQEIMTVESFDELFPEYKDVPYDQKQIFINECLYDVQQGKKRDINEFADFFGSMSMKEGYVNQQDATIQYLTDSDVAKYSLNAFLGGSETLEGRTPEQIRDYIEAAYTIKAYADEINKQGYNVTDSAGWTIVKSFADDFEDLNQAIKTFENFNLTNTEAYKINNLYEKNLRTQNELINDFVYGNETEQHNALKQFEDQYLYQFHKDYINSFIREVTWDYQKDMEGPIKSSDWNEFLMWLYQDYYEIDGRRFNKDGEEILHSEGRDGFLNKVADGFIGLASEVETLGFDTAIAQKAWKESDDLNYQRERTMDVLFDTVNVAFSGMMEFTGGGQLFQFATTLGRAGAQLDWLFAKTMEGLGFVAEGMANMIGFTDGRSPESKEKYKQAMEGIGIMLLGRLKSKIVRKGKAEMLKYLDETAMMKALKAYVAQTAEGLEVRDGGKVKEVIKNKGKTEEKKGEPKTRKEVEQKAKTEKKTEEKISKEENQKGAITLKQGTQENALKSFREIFDEEIQKVNAEGKNTKVVDTLFQAASSLADKIFTEKTGEKEAPKETVKAPEIASESPIEGKTETITTNTPESKIQQTEATTEQTDIQTTPEAPGVVVKETSTRAPETPEGVAETREPESVKEAKTTIAKILDVIQNIQDNVKNVVDNIFKPSETKKIREREIQRQKDEQLLREAGLSNEEIDLVMNNPFGETLLDVINAMTKEITNKKGKIKEVQKDMDLNNGEIQREVLADGVKEIQEYVDKLVDMKNKLGKLYEELSTDRKIDTTDFATSEELANVLDGFKLELTEEIGEDLQIKTRVRKKGGGEMTAEQETIAKYVEAMIDNVIRRRSISEADAQAIRTKFDWKDDTVGSPSKAAKNSFRDAFNKFLDKQEGTDLLRKIDAGYSKISEAIKDLKEILTKDNQVKETAKNKILNWDEETLNQMEELVPGIKQLVELARKSPDIVKKGVASKMKTKDTRRWLADPVRYTFVGLPTLIGATTGGIGGGVLGIILGSFIFKRSENLGGKLKGKIVKKAPDLKRFDAFVDNLSLSDKEKSAYKKEVLDNIDKIREKLQGEREAEFNEIMAEVNKIIIDRKAGDILDKLSETEPTPPEGPDGTPPSGGSAKAEEKITPMEQKIVEASLGKEEGETYSEKAETIANELLKLEKTVDDITTDYATEKLEERGEDVTPENIEKVKQEPEKEGDIMDFLRDMESDKQYTTDPTQPDYRKTDLDTLMEIAEHPEKYPNVDIEEVNDAINYILEKNAMAEMREGGGMRGSDINMEYTFAAEVDRVNGMEQRMADAKTPETKENLKREWIRAKESVIEEISQAYNIDQFEAADKFDSLSNASLRTIEEGNRTKNGYKGKHRVSKAEQDKLLALMGKGPSQNITYTSTSDNIATLENPASRKRVAEQRIRQVVDPKLEKAKIGINKDKIARTTAKWQAEKEALENIIKQADEQLKPQQEVLEQKKQIAEETKTLTEKRKNTKSREEKKELTKKIDENQDAFEKLTYEELGELYDKPDDVIEKEAKDAEELAGKEHLIDSKQYNPRKVNVAEREIKHNNPKEKDIWTDSNGEEVTFYHGTPNGGFEEFSMDFRGKSNDRNGPGDYGRGMYFTPYKDTAMGYTKHSKAKSENPEIYEAKLKMENPLRLDLYHKFQKAMWKLMKEDTDRGYSLISKEHGENVNRLMKEFGLTEELYDRYEDMISSLGDNRWDMDIRNHGYDGIISEDGKEVIIPDPDQIIIQKHYSTREKTPELKEINNGSKAKIENKKAPKTVKELKEKGFTDEEIEKLQNLNIASDPLNEYLKNSTKVPEAYKAMNRELADVQAEFVDTMRALSKLDNYEGELRRGGNGKEFGENIKEGDTIENKQLLFSSDVKIEDSAYKDSPVYYKINAKGKGTKDSVIEGGKERDFVTMPGQKFKVEKITKEGDKTIYEITEIDDTAEPTKKDEEKKIEPKKEAPKTETKVEEGKEPGSEPLMKIENDGYVYNEPMPGDLKTEVIFERMEYIRKKAKETKKLTQKESAEFAKLKDLYKRQLEWEAREKQADMTDEELDDMYEKMYTHGPQSTAGIDVGQFVTD